MDKVEHEENEKKLLEIYNAISDSRKQRFMNALVFLSECFLDE